MDSIQRRVAALEAAIEQANAAERVHRIELIVIFTPAEHEALARLRESQPPVVWPRTRGLVRLEFSSIDAGTYLRQHGIEPPAWTEEEKEFFGISPQTQE
jgi:hypothetical protein